MISHEHKTIFVHVPKTAGQSMEQVFIDASASSWETRERLILGFNPHPTLGPQRLSHMLASEYAGLGYIDQESFDQYYKFAFVRNPWDRLVSQYYYRVGAREKPFAEFVKHSFANIDPRSDLSRHIIPQSDYVFDDNGELLVDFVGKYENIKPDFEVVCRAVSLPVQELPRKNVYGMNRWRKLFRVDAKRPAYQEHYSDELRDIVGEFYQSDIENFDYSFTD